MDVTDQPWTIIEPLFEEKRRPDGRGRPWCDARAVLNGVLWVLRTARGAPQPSSAGNGGHVQSLRNATAEFETVLVRMKFVGLVAVAKLSHELSIADWPQVANHDLALQVHQRRFLTL